MPGGSRLRNRLWSARPSRRVPRLDALVAVVVLAAVALFAVVGLAVLAVIVAGVLVTGVALVTRRAWRVARGKAPAGRRGRGGVIEATATEVRTDRPTLPEDGPGTGRRQETAAADATRLAW